MSISRNLRSALVVAGALTLLGGASALARTAVQPAPAAPAGQNQNRQDATDAGQDATDSGQDATDSAQEPKTATPEPAGPDGGQQGDFQGDHQDPGDSNTSD